MSDLRKYLCQKQARNTFKSALFCPLQLAENSGTFSMFSYNRYRLGPCRTVVCRRWRCKSLGVDTSCWRWTRIAERSRYIILGTCCIFSNCFWRIILGILWGSWQSGRTPYVCEELVTLITWLATNISLIPLRLAWLSFVWIHFLWQFQAN